MDISARSTFSIGVQCYSGVEFKKRQSHMTEQTEALTVGWREWVGLPGLGIDSIKCKVDTGARTSALHAFAVDSFTRDGVEWVRFGLHPKQHDTDTEVWCEAPVKDVRNVTDSGGNITERYFIETEVQIGNKRFAIELSLTCRDTMMFRMLLGRQALKQKRLIVDSGASYLQSGRHGRSK